MRARGWLVLLAVLAGGAGRATAEATSPGVLVELFTSQGCSSCPPADRLLAELAAREDVVTLAFHVDYWNRIGWRDPFSSPRWSERQRLYARRLGSGVYTPQAVVGGSAEAVGSDRRELARLLAAARRSPACELRLGARRGAGGLEVEAGVTALAAPAGAELELFVAVFEDGLETAVLGGENARRRLENGSVVRRLERALELGGGAGSARLSIALERGWRAERLGVAAFVQDRATLAVLGARRLQPPLAATSGR